MMEWLAMGGYWPYVWSSYALALVVLGGNMLWPYVRLCRLRKALQQEDDAS